MEIVPANTHLRARSLLLLVSLLAAPALARANAATEGAAVDEELVIAEYGDDLDEQGAGFPDPLENVNRGTLALNQTIDRWLLSPISSVYRFVVPEVGRTGIRNLLANLNSPAMLVNDLLQLEFHDAGVTTARFIANSTFGVAGLIDVAELAGVPAHPSDFGQTLARAGVESGPYIMLPVLGPTTLRDGTGAIVDVLMRPTTYVLVGADQALAMATSTIQTGGEGLADLDYHRDSLQMLDDSSIDFYAALRSAYYQNRMAQIRSRED